jgi:hypothetical protein
LPAASRAGHHRGTAPSRHQAGDPTDAAKLALGSITRRWLQLTQEITTLDTQLDRLVAMAAPALVAVKGVGIQTAAVLLVAAGDNPQRLGSEAAFAHLCGVAPIPARFGQDHPAPAEPGRQPGGDLGVIAARGRADGLAPTDPRLRPATHRAGQDHRRDHPLSESATSLESSTAS